MEFLLTGYSYMESNDEDMIGKPSFQENIESGKSTCACRANLFNIGHETKLYYQ